MGTISGTKSIVGDRFDFHLSASREGGDLHGGAGRAIPGERPPIDFVHGGKVREVRHEDGRFDDIVQGQSLVLEDDFEVFQCPLCLRANITVKQLPGFGNYGDLPGAKQKVAHAHAVTVWTACGSGPGWFDDALGHKSREFKL